MTSYSSKSARTLVVPRKVPIGTVAQDTRTYNGDAGFSRDAKSELFVLAVTFMGEKADTFYESGSDRHARFVKLVQEVSKTDPEWMQGFLPFLRKDAFMRTASVVAAVEYARSGAPKGAQTLASALARADEPAEALGYHFAKYGKRLPAAVKKGIAFAARNLYDEYGVMKYDGNSKGIRVGDVLNIVHPKPKDEAQGYLFKYSLDRRHHGDEKANIALTPKLYDWEQLQSIDESKRRAWFASATPAELKAMGMTWERLSGWLPGGMDAEAWTKVIPSMGHMALLRNLRNFDQAGIDAKTAAEVAARLSDPEAVAKGMQFPYRYYTALKQMVTHRYNAALEAALDLSVRNVPRLKGKSLVMIDLSGSMQSFGGYGYGRNRNTDSSLAPWESAAIFGVAQHLKAGESTLVAWAETNRVIPLPNGSSVLKGVEAVHKVLGTVGYSTNIWPAIERHYDGHDRIFIFTDMQSNAYYGRNYVEAKIAHVPVYNFNLGGYKATNMAITGNKYEFGGLSDATFKQIALLENGKDATWPWLQ